MTSLTAIGMPSNFDKDFPADLRLSDSLANSLASSSKTEIKAFKSLFFSIAFKQSETKSSDFISPASNFSEASIKVNLFRSAIIPYFNIAFTLIKPSSFAGAFLSISSRLDLVVILSSRKTFDLPVI